MERQSDNVGEYRGLHTLADKAQRSTTIALLSVQSSILTRYAHFIVALLSREVGDCFLTCWAFFLRSPTEFRIRTKHLLNTLGE